MGAPIIAVYDRGVRWLTVLLCLVFAAIVSAQKRPPGTVVQGELGKRLEAVVPAKAPGFWGAVLVATEGKVVFARGYGPVDRLEDRRSKEMSSKSVFDIGGAAGLLTTILALRLQQEGKLMLSDAVGDHLADWPDDKRAITLDHLLRHASGLPRKLDWKGAEDRGARPTAAAFARTRLDAAPGAAIAYSPFNPILLALVIEESTGQRYDKLLEAKVLRPFGMTGAGPTSSRFDKRLLTTRRKADARDGVPANQVVYNWRQRGGRAVLASVFDVHELLEHMTAGKLLDAEQRGLLLRPFGDGSVRVTQIDTAGQRVVRIEGYTEGFKTWWTLHEASRSWVVLFTGEEHGPFAIEEAMLLEVAQTLLPATAPVVEPEPAAPELPVKATTPAATPAATTEQIERFVGDYALPAGGTFRIERAGAGLRLRASGVQAAVRIGEGSWPGQGGALALRAEDRGLSLLSRLLAGDATVVDEAFAAAAAANAGSTLLAGILADHGALTRIEFVGNESDKRSVRSWFHIVCANGDAWITADWQDARRFARLGSAVASTPFVIPLTVVGPDRATAQALGGAALDLTLEGRTGQRVLVFGDGSAGENGLIDCRETPK